MDELDWSKSGNLLILINFKEAMNVLANNLMSQMSVGPASYQASRGTQTPTLWLPSVVTKQVKLP